VEEKPFQIGEGREEQSWPKFNLISFYS